MEYITGKWSWLREIVNQTEWIRQGCGEQYYANRDQDDD